MKKVAVLQSNYIPWKGYFDIIHDVDIFVFYDDVQYTNNDWRNRNKVKTKSGELWLKVPIESNGGEKQLIHEAVIDIKKTWQEKHFNTLIQNYTDAPYFKEFRELLEHIYLEKIWDNLSELNQYIIKMISCEFLGIKTKFEDSRKYNVTGVKQERLLNLIKETKLNTYVSGPAARNYIVEKDFYNAGIEIEWKDYLGYPVYQQMHGEFNHNVSILDLLFNTGKDAPYYIWGWRNNISGGA